MNQDFSGSKLQEKDTPRTIIEILMNSCWDLLTEVEEERIANPRSVPREWVNLILKFNNLEKRTKKYVSQKFIPNEKISVKGDIDLSLKIMNIYLLKLQEIGFFSIDQDEVLLC